MPSRPAARHRLGYPAAGVNKAMSAPPGSATITELPPTAEFPHLSVPRPAELPALADLFGLREQRPE